MVMKSDNVRCLKPTIILFCLLNRNKLTFLVLSKVSVPEVLLNLVLPLGHLLLVYLLQDVLTSENRGVFREDRERLEPLWNT